MAIIKRGISSKNNNLEFLGEKRSDKFKCNVCKKTVSLFEKNACNIQGCPLKDPIDKDQEETEVNEQTNN